MIEISVSPVAFRWGPLTIGWYGIMVELAVITIILWLWRAVKRGSGLTTVIKGTHNHAQGWV